MPLASRMRISLVPAPTSSNGFQSVGSSPAWTFPNWKPASFRASLGNASKSSEADPTQRICFSSSIQPACIKYYTRLRVQVKLFGEQSEQRLVNDDCHRVGGRCQQRTPELERRLRGGPRSGSPVWTRFELLRAN